MMVKVTVNNIEVEVQKETRILHAAKKAGFKIPSLCYVQDIPATASCGVCMIEANGQLLRACSTECIDGMKITTHSKKLMDLRYYALQLVLMNHPNNCPECVRNGTCELQSLAQEMGIRELPVSSLPRPHTEIDSSSQALIMDPRYCILCGRCIHVCNEIQGVHALTKSNRGFDSLVGPSFERKLEESECVKCGQCSAYCPVAAIYEKDATAAVWEALDDPEMIVVAQEAPAVRVALGEEFGLEPGTNVVGEMYTALRMLGFDYIFDTNFGADLTIMEEAMEFATILTENPEKLPLITSCCPSWVDYLEKFYHDLIPYFSTAKSPHQMVGTMVKTYWAKKMNVAPEKIFLVSIMPCTAKKYEIERMEDMYASGYKDVDVTITTREFARMLKQRGIDLNGLPKGVADDPLGQYTGAATIFGATGGVMEAAIRTAYYYVTGEDMPNPNVEFVRGHKAIKTGELEVAGTKLRIAVASGLANVKELLDRVRKAKEEGSEMPYHFIEVMACRGGCVGGGGQPYLSLNLIRDQRAKGLYKEDGELQFKHSHHNPSIKVVYDEFLEKPNSKTAHKLLHTSYIARPIKYTSKD
jgi:NADP-reducing hydrogenase subunit HndD